jgi:hypothetical protein
MMYPMVYILIMLLLIIILAYIYAGPHNRIGQYEINKRQAINDTQTWLHQSVSDVCRRCNMSPIYNIIETSQITYTDKVINPHNINGTIYLVIWDEKHDRTFNHNTLIYAVLHEIAHILSPSIHHEPPFDTIETILLNKARELKYYDPNTGVEPHYITLDLLKSK